MHKKRIRSLFLCFGCGDHVIIDPCLAHREPDAVQEVKMRDAGDDWSRDVPPGMIWICHAEKFNIFRLLWTKVKV